MNEEQQNGFPLQEEPTQNASQEAAAPPPEQNENALLRVLKSATSFFGRGMMGVMSDEAPSGPPDARERKALDLPEQPQVQQESETPPSETEKV